MPIDYHDHWRVLYRNLGCEEGTREYGVYGMDRIWFNKTPEKTQLLGLMALRQTGAHWNKTGKKEILGAFGFLVMLFFAFFVFPVLLYYFFPDLNPNLAFGLHLCFLVILYLLVVIWGRRDRLRKILSEWLSSFRES